MAAFKPAYLIHGDDHGRIAERRARLRALAEAESGTEGIEVLEGESANVDATTAALCAMTFALGRRFVIVDGVERWKDSELEPLQAVLADLPPETTVAFFGREEGRLKVPAPLFEAVRGAGGDVAAEQAVKAADLPRWVIARGHELGLEIGLAAAKGLVAHVGERQQRLLRELEKMALELPAGASVDAEVVDALAADSSERRAWSLADALVAGDGAAAARLYLELRSQGERVPSLLYWMARRVREAHSVAARLEAGEPAAAVRRTLRMPPAAARRLVEDAQRSDPGRLRRALERLADLELSSRGGGSPGQAEDTAALRTIAAVAGG